MTESQSTENATDAGDAGHAGHAGETDAVSLGDQSLPTPLDEAKLSGFDALLRYLKTSRGVDFSGYKVASLTRRVDKRMSTIGISDYAAFIDHLEADPREFQELLNEVLINVTSFFRDPETWTGLARQIVAPLVERLGPNDPIRVWCAGCASGEEAYTIAIVLNEALGEAAFRTRVKIYATDADEAALAFARLGVYDERQLREVSAEWREKYFERNREGRYTFRADLRRSLIFGRHDLMSDAPISRIDLLTCRNVLMYFNAEMQARILSRFAAALNDGGALFLGRAETLLSRTTLFAPIDLKRRIFARLNGPLLRDRLSGLTSDGLRLPSLPPDDPGLARLREVAFHNGPVPQIVVNLEGVLVLANQRAREVFRISPADLGRPIQDLELSYRPLELRSRVDELRRVGRSVAVTGVSWTQPGGGLGTLDVDLHAMTHPQDGMIGVSMHFTDTTDVTRMRRDLEHTNQELETAYEELQSTNEELETTNEELQSTVEELETTNEELQSTNEELETMNEELQSTNEELQSMNDALRGRGVELEQMHAFINVLLTSFRSGVVVLDREMRILAWNGYATEQWGLRPEETVGKHFFGLDIGLPLESLHQPLRACLSGEGVDERVVIAATNRRGRPVSCEVRCLPLVEQGERPRGVILLLDSTGADDAE